MMLPDLFGLKNIRVYMIDIKILCKKAMKTETWNREKQPGYC